MTASVVIQMLDVMISVSFLLPPDLNISKTQYQYYCTEYNNTDYTDQLSNLDVVSKLSVHDLHFVLCPVEKVKIFVTCDCETLTQMLVSVVITLFNMNINK